MLNRLLYKGARMEGGSDFSWLWFVGIASPIIGALHLLHFKQYQKIDDKIAAVKDNCVHKDSCKEDRERFDKSVDELKRIIEGGFREVSGSVKGVHHRIDKLIKK